MGWALANDAAASEKSPPTYLDDSEVVPDPVDRAVEGAAAHEIGERAIEFTDREIPVPAPSQEQRVVRFDLDPTRERGDRFAKLPRAGLGHPEVDDARDVPRVGRESGSRGPDGVGIREGAVLDALGRSVLN